MVKQITRIAFYVIAAALSLAAFFLFIRILWQVVLKTSGDRRREILAFLFLILGLLLAVSLFSFSPADFARTTTAESVANFGGVFGALAAHWLYWALGYFSYAVPVALFAWAYNRARGLDMAALAGRTVLAVALLVILGLLVSIVPVPSGQEGFKLAGEMGSAAASFSKRFLGDPGSYIVGFGLLIVALSGEAVFRNVLKRLYTRLRRPRVKIKFARPANARKTTPKKPRRTPAEKPAEKPKPEPAPAQEEPVSISAKPEGRDALDDSYRADFLSILTDPPPFAPSETKEDLRKNSEMLERKLLDYSIGGRVVNVSSGPVITRYEFEPAAGVKVSRVAGLADDLALAMKAERIRIVAPIPGKAAIGIEIPNKKRENVYLKDILVSDICARAKSPLTVALGKDIAGEPTISDVARMPHLLIAGATGSGKSVAINTMVASILFRASPSEVRFLMIDPKRLELPVYNGVPHQINPVVTEPKTSLDKLKEVIGWMDTRYREFAAAGVRDIEGYNSKMRNKKPYILIIVDELADLMITAPTEIEETLTRLAQMSRAVGIHLILATQRPSVDVITGLIKANFPARIAFQVASKTDSRTILDMNGAEKLLGRGDMLFLPPGKGEPVRIHGAYISTQEAKRIAQTWSAIHMEELLRGIFPKDKAGQIVEVVMDEEVVDCIVDRRTPGRREALQSLARRLASEAMMDEEDAFTLFDELEYYPSLDEQSATESERRAQSVSAEEGRDELFEEARKLVVRHQIASVSLLQRRLKIGYARAGRLIDQLEREGIVGPYSGSKAREVLVSEESEVAT